MIIVKPGGHFLNKGAIVPEGKELAVMIGALHRERNRVVKAGRNTYYGLMTIKELDTYVAELRHFKEERGD